MKKKFTIITVVKNNIDHIEETIKSVLNQSIFEKKHEELEYFIHDGASTDGTKELIKKYADLYPQIIFSSYKDNGMYEALSSNIKNSKGQYIAYINSGDFYYKKSFEIVKNIFESNSEIKWLTGAKFFYNENSEIIDFTTPFKYRRNLIRKGAYGKYLPFIQQESTFWRNDISNLIDNEYLSKLKFSGDMFIWNSLAKENEIYIVDTYLSGFKYHKNQLTFSMSGSTKEYLEETNNFSNKLNILDFFQIILDSIPWFLLRSLKYKVSKLNKNYVAFDKYNLEWESFKKRNLKYYCWYSELNDNQGEGILGKDYIKSLIKYLPDVNMVSYKTKFSTKSDIFKSKFIDKNLNKSFFSKYLVPIIGIFYGWFYYIQNKKFIYLNYLPLWNFLLFVLMPPKTLFGPITGGIYKGSANNIENFLRKFAVPICYKISLFFLKFRKQVFLFSTENLTEVLNENIKKKSKLNFFINKLNINKEEKIKDIDILVYHRRYESKKFLIVEKFIKNLSGKLNIHIVGDNMKNDEIVNHGLINKDKVLEILKKTKFAILSAENISSLFARDCIEMNVNFFYDNQINIPDAFRPNENINKMIPISFDDIPISSEKILKTLKEQNYSKDNFKINDIKFDDEIKDNLKKLKFINL